MWSTIPFFGNLSGFRTNRTQFSPDSGTTWPGTLKVPAKKFGPLNHRQWKATTNFQKKMISSSILALVCTGGHYKLDTDTCGVQLSRMHLQEQPDKTKRMIVNWPKWFTYAAKTYSSAQRDCLKIVLSTILLPPYFKKGGFAIRTDHNSLVGMWI